MFQLSAADVALPEPRDKGMGIAIVGCGEIARIAHLPAYRNANLNVLACYDIDRNVAQRFAADFGIPNCCNSIDEVFELDAVSIVDIAFHTSGRLEVVERCASAGRHILMQKPVAHSLDEAKKYVEIAERAGIKMQVNQQARWAGQFRALHQWITTGAIGRLNFINFEMRGWQDDPATWYVRQKNMTLVDHGIHYFDLLRYFCGAEPTKVGAMHKSVSGQHHISPTIYSAVIHFENVLASHSFNNIVVADEPWQLAVTADGTEGFARATFNDAALHRKGEETIVLPASPPWFPDAFAGPMCDLIDSIVDDREPACSGRENLGTLRLVLGALESARTGEFVNL